MKFNFTKKQKAAYTLLELPITATPEEIDLAYNTKKGEGENVVRVGGELAQAMPKMSYRDAMYEAKNCYYEQENFKREQLAKRKDIPRYDYANTIKYMEPLKDPNTTKETLVEFFGDVNNDVRFLGRYPLEIAVQLNNMPVVRLLLELEADVNCPHEGNSDPNPIMQAILNQNGDMVELLCQQPSISLNEALNFSYSSKATPLNKTIELGNAPIVQTLINHGVNVNQSNTDVSASPLVTALISGKFDIADMLINAGADTEKAKVQLNVVMKKMVHNAIQGEIKYIKASNMFESTINKKITQLRERYRDTVDDAQWARLIAPQPIALSDLMGGGKSVDPMQTMVARIGAISAIIQSKKAISHLNKVNMATQDSAQLNNFLKLEGLIMCIVESTMNPPQREMLLLNQDAKIELLYTITKTNASFESIKSALTTYNAAVDSMLNRTDKNHLKSSLTAYIGGKVDIAALTLDQLPLATPPTPTVQTTNASTAAPHSSMFGQSAARDPRATTHDDINLSMQKK